MVERHTSPPNALRYVRTRLILRRQRSAYAQREMVIQNRLRRPVLCHHESLRPAVTSTHLLNLCQMDCHECIKATFLQPAHPLQKKSAVHVLDSIEAEARTASGLTHSFISALGHLDLERRKRPVRSSRTSRSYLFGHLGAEDRPMARVNDARTRGQIKVFTSAPRR